MGHRINRDHNRASLYHASLMLEVPAGLLYPDDPWFRHRALSAISSRNRQGRHHAQPADGVVLGSGVLRSYGSSGNAVDRCGHGRPASSISVGPHVRCAKRRLRRAAVGQRLSLVCQFQPFCGERAAIGLWQRRSALPAGFVQQHGHAARRRSGGRRSRPAGPLRRPNDPLLLPQGRHASTIISTRSTPMAPGCGS